MDVYLGPWDLILCIVEYLVDLYNSIFGYWMWDRTIGFSKSDCENSIFLDEKNPMIFDEKNPIFFDG